MPRRVRERERREGNDDVEAIESVLVDLGKTPLPFGWVYPQSRGSPGTATLTMAYYSLIPSPSPLDRHPACCPCACPPAVHDWSANGLPCLRIRLRPFCCFVSLRRCCVTELALSVAIVSRLAGHFTASSAKAFHQLFEISQ